MPKLLSVIHKSIEIWFKWHYISNVVEARAPALPERARSHAQQAFEKASPANLDRQLHQLT